MEALPNCYYIVTRPDKKQVKTFYCQFKRIWCTRKDRFLNYNFSLLDNMQVGQKMELTSVGHRPQLGGCIYVYYISIMKLCTNAQNNPQESADNMHADEGLCYRKKWALVT